MASLSSPEDDLPTVALSSLVQPEPTTRAASIPVASVTATPISSPPPPPSSSPSMSPDNVKLIIASSVVGGLVLISFLVYVGVRLFRGDDIADVLKLRRRPAAVHLDDDEAPPSITFGEGAFIHCTQRYSVRSYRYPSRLSMLSTKSRREASRSSNTLKSPTSPYKQYTEQYLVRPPSAKRPSASRNNTDPLPQVPTTPDSGKVMNSFLFNASSDTTLAKPEMAQFRTGSSGSSSPMTPTTPHGAPEVVGLPTSNAHRRLTITERPITPHGGPNRKSSRFTEDDKERWSWTNSEAPSTPKYKLERAPSTDPSGPRVVMERIDEDGADLTRTKSSTSRPKSSHDKRKSVRDKEREKELERNLKSAMRSSEVPVEGRKGRRLSKAAHQHTHARVPSLTQIIRNLSVNEQKGDEEVMLKDRKPGA
ncbi:hypothetical protein BDZ85DRAFT_73090 [Elsinoe ampelina]|uniref:Uncharacterized protein n=1 Tax=Elsinoe ampelina TaxID=302913 RepID=A0A6A6GJL3_9PEZI|nr:hypothetical protein BDZ85DRAFT_73090 [Elsinoe ampelina]